MTYDFFHTFAFRLYDLYTKKHNTYIQLFLLSFLIVIAMWRNVHKAKLIVITFVFTLILSQFVFGLWNPTLSATITKSENILTEKSSLSNDDKPDLVIEDIFLWSSNEPDKYVFKYSLRNIGTIPIYSFELVINHKIQWLLFGRIPLFTIDAHTQTGNLGSLLPGETFNHTFISCDSLPKFGSYRFTLTVNPNKTIDESDYSNNKYSEDWTTFLGQWKPLI
ncbi:MAG: hypothetical protein MUC80_00455 [Candidatus Thermoplasmatota archaeon]|nr:hypothetical protein [Candidatus Thermoplasmatota archaeon]